MAGFIKLRFTGLDLKKEPDRWKLWSTYRDPEYQPLRDWASLKGKNLYVAFLLSHPKYTLLIDEPKDNLKRIFSVYPGYITSINGYSCYSEKWFPFFSPLSLLIFILVLGWIFFKTQNVEILFPVILSFLFLFHVFLIYNADTCEVERHLFISMIMVQFISLIAISFILDELIQKIKLTINRSFSSST